MDAYIEKLVVGWEETYRKGQLNLWIMLALKDSAKHMADIKNFIISTSEGTVTADDKSIYRALRRYYEAELVNFHKVPSSSGPELKVYELTDIGWKVLEQFVERNIIHVLYKDSIRQLITKGKNE